MKLTRASALVLVAFSVPVVVELRVLLGFFGVYLPVEALVAFEVVFLLAVAVAYTRGAESTSAAKH